MCVFTSLTANEEYNSHKNLWCHMSLWCIKVLKKFSRSTVRRCKTCKCALDCSFHTRYITFSSFDTKWRERAGGSRHAPNETTMAIKWCRNWKNSDANEILSTMELLRLPLSQGLPTLGWSQSNFRFENVPPSTSKLCKLITKARSALCTLNPNLYSRPVWKSDR